MKVVYLDTETTGLLEPSGVSNDKQPHIIDIGMVITSNGEVEEKYSTLVKPPVPVTEKITEITKITNDDVKAAPVFKDVALDIKQRIEAADFLVAHNANFDVSIIKCEFSRVGITISFPKIICTVEEFTPVFGFKPKLTEVYDYVFGEPYVEQHRALSDALDLYKICKEVGIPC